MDAHTMRRALLSAAWHISKNIAWDMGCKRDI